MTKTNLTRRTALIGAAGAGLAVSACSQSPDVFQPVENGHFNHGVASGDPDQSSVMLWTALTNDGGGYRGVEVARDEAFTDIVFEQGEEITYVMMQPLGTLKILATGLEPGTSYFYRFRLNDQYSPVGVTRTLPEGALDQYRIGVFSCSNFPAGHFNVYREAAENGELDLVVHLGDYLYEYAPGQYATENSDAMNRVPVPAHEIVSYEDYVGRHAQYKSDPDLQALHAAAPWIISWDDHETANNSWREGAQNHNEGEGSWEDRRNAALRAWYDWQPAREPADDLREHRGTYEIGDLATLCLLESRLTARDQEIGLDTFPIPSDADDTDPANLEAVAAWKRDVVGAEDRTLLGADQIADIGAACAASKAAGKPWRILANQVIMARVNFPNFATEMPGWLRWWATRDSEFARQFIMRTRFGIPFNLDMWDGYSAERDRLYAALRAAEADIITITGDVHSFWANDLVDGEGNRIGTELVGASVTSPSPFSGFKAPGVDYGQMMIDANPDVGHCNMEDHGYIRLTLTRDAADAEFIKVSDILTRDYRAGVESAWRIHPAEGGDVAAAERVS
ncbi:alkaline phosphatase D family protein [Maricaulis maris]|uniref:Alkaline phosphatase/alkaline phosphatase D n=1 Tax=Maricaulis maris TaxID=74318 RepID=A0A495CY33_9PROT|nr:alkaline phosphatase D family protein [Maricaulis maris]RKQ94198.1 alkaline phosphatase/alkaline phosphatase D [Maricaulis maris]